jgi:hypothetical protein
LLVPPEVPALWVLPPLPELPPLLLLPPLPDPTFDPESSSEQPPKIAVAVSVKIIASFIELFMSEFLGDGCRYAHRCRRRLRS